MNAHIVIPARMASTRLPNKPLADIGGVPMLVRVAQQVAGADVSDVVAAVDHQAVFEAAAAAGVQVLMTRQDHPAGSDRVMEVVERMGWDDNDIVVNVQGDEPLMPPAVIDRLVTAMRAEPAIELATLAEPVGTRTELVDANLVKVVCDRHGDALYFSRAPVPFPRDEQGEQLDSLGLLRHVGVYAFRVEALRRFVRLQNSRLERIEKLEQLRWLEAGYRIRVLLSEDPIPGGVDTPEDLARVRQVLAQRT